MGRFSTLFGLGKSADKTSPQKVAAFDIDAYVAEMEARTGNAERSSQLPGWALILRSPWRQQTAPTSWIGGQPVAPSGFSWPRDSNGAPLHFLAQIDLTRLLPVPSSGATAPGLPRNGALLVFVGESYACRVVGEAGMALASPTAPPDDLGDLARYGFYDGGPAFPYWPVDPVAFMDVGGDRPSNLPNPFAQPEDWITTWGLAALEANIVIEVLERELGFGESFFRFLNSEAAKANPSKNARVIESKTRFYGYLADKAPPVIDMLKLWRDFCNAQSPTGETDIQSVRDVFAERIKLADPMENYIPKLVLPGNPGELWQRLRQLYPGLESWGGHPDLPLAYQPFAEARITDWRGHRLFGLEPVPENNGEDLRRHDSLIAIAADPLLGTQSEHESGMSIWCPGTDLSRGEFETGQFLRHCAV